MRTLSGALRLGFFISHCLCVAEWLDDALAPLVGQCAHIEHRGEWWSYEWCHRLHVKQYHRRPTGEIEQAILLGRFDAESTRTRRGASRTHHFSNGAECHVGARRRPAESSPSRRRSAEVRFMCCDKRPAAEHDKNGTYIEVVQEPRTCEYAIKVCSKHVCAAAAAASARNDRSHSMPKHERIQYREAVREMFQHAYDGYLEHGYPESELRPTSCVGGPFELCKLSLVTLIDAMDTLAIMGNRSEFQRAVKLVSAHADFAVDRNVSVFETNIRVLGGLLSSHMLATDRELALMDDDEYGGELLSLAADLADRLMPAFNTSTGIPYGTVNLQSGVPKDETVISSLAGAGSLSLEFSVLSALTGRPEYSEASQRAVRALYQRRSVLGLVGKHINIRTGKWVESILGIGSNADSYFEYLLKMYLLFGDEAWWDMFSHSYAGIERYLKHGDWYADVDMYSGKARRQRFENLQAFWPGLQALLGELDAAARSLNAFYLVWRDWGFVPEEYDYVQWGNVPGGGHQRYPLRPELIESTYLLHRATAEPSWLWAGRDFIDSLQRWARTSCGYATVRDIVTLELEDEMPSFFLSETTKYLYLLFDEDNFVHRRPYVFSTEAHPFLASALVPPRKPLRASRNKPAVSVGPPASDDDAPTTRSKPGWSERIRSSLRKAFGDGAEGRDTGEEEAPDELQHHASPTPAEAAASPRDDGKVAPGLGTRQCAVQDWWSRYAYDPNYEDSLGGERPDVAASESNPQCEPSDQEQDARSSNRAAQIDMGALGKFQISVFSDGFHVENEADGETLEISNIGSAVMLVRDQLNIGGKEPPLIRTVMADRHGFTIGCAMHLPDTPATECTVAAFGPTAHAPAIDPVSAKIAVAPDGLGCKPLVGDQYRGTIMVLRRGVCMFEQKAETAASAGALALVIVNADDQRFIMAPMAHQDGEDDEEDDDGVEEEEEEEVADEDYDTAASWGRIPTVMVTKQDGDRLLQSAGQRLVLEVTKRHQDVLPTSEERIYPMVRFVAKAVQILGFGEWGALLASPRGTHDYQLFIVPKNQNSKAGPTSEVEGPQTHRVLRTVGGQFVCVPTYGDLHPYSAHAREVCGDLQST